MPRTFYPSSLRARRTLDGYGRPGLLCCVGGAKANEMNWRRDAADVNDVKVLPGSHSLSFSLSLRQAVLPVSYLILCHRLIS